MEEQDLTDKAQNDELVMSLVDMALAQPRAERMSYLLRACEDDSSLFQTVWRYVESEERMNGFMLQPLIAAMETETALKAGDLVEGRFRIISEVARGGMGIVYEATDQKLNRRIAIKCAQAGFQRRLPPEVRNAGEINHPNVCKTFDIHTTTVDGCEVDFISMEFLEGPTLAARIREGLLPEGEACLIAKQLCAGLSEAHRNQVIHGDLKSSNIILTTAGDGSTRAVITDFGLAHHLDASYGPLHSDAGGTPDYMAPELWKGERPSTASDVYALGVILHELATGRRPFAADIPIEERLVRKPPPPRSKWGHRWGHVVARCLDPDPVKRPQSGMEVARALVPSDTRRWFLAAAAAVALAVISVYLTYRTTTAPVEWESLAVLPFTSSADNAALSEGLLIETGERLRRLKPAKRRLMIIPVTDAIQNKVDRPNQALTTLGAKYVLHGELQRNGERLLVTALLTDSRTQAHLKEWHAQYSMDRARDLPIAMAGMVTATLRLPPLAVAATVNQAAYADYAAGVSLSRRNPTLDRAIPLLERAVQADPGSPLTHAKLAEAQWMKFRVTGDARWSERAQQSLRMAEGRNPDIAAVRFVAGLIHEQDGQYEQAAADYLRAVELEPGYGDAWRRLGKVYENSNQPSQALDAYHHAIEVQPDYWRNYQDLGTFYFFRTEYEEAIQQYKRCVQVAPDLASAHYALAAPYLNLGRYADAEAELQISLGLQEFPNARLGLGLSLMYQGREREAIPHLKRAIEIGPPMSLYQINLGTALRRAGLARESLEAYRKGKEISQAVLTQNPRDAIESSQLAYLYARLGDGPQAILETARALQISGKNNRVRWTAVLTYEALGRRDLTLPLLQDAPQSLLGELSRFPDLADLRADPGFQRLLGNHNSK